MPLDPDYPSSAQPARPTPAAPIVRDGVVKQQYDPPTPSPKGPSYGSSSAAENGMAGNAPKPTPLTSIVRDGVVKQQYGSTSPSKPAPVGPTRVTLEPTRVSSGPVALKPGQRNSSDYGGPRAGVVPAKPDSATPSKLGVKLGDDTDSQIDPVRPSAGVASINGGNDSGSPTGKTGGVLSISHDSQTGGKKGGSKATGGIFTPGSNGDKNNGTASLGTAVALGGSAGLSDLQKFRKFSFQIEKTEGKLGRLATQETQIRQQMAGATDPSQKQQLAMQLGSVQQQQQTATERLHRKETRLNNVQNRMASAGTSDQLNQGVKAVVIGQNDKKNGNGPKNGGGQGNNQAQGGIGTKLVNVGGPDSGRPQAGDLNPGRNKNDGPKMGGGGQVSQQNQGGKALGLANVGGPDAGRPQIGAAGGQFDNGASKPHVKLSGIGGPDSGRPQLGGDDGGNQGPPRAVVVGQGNNGGGNGGGGQGQNQGPKAVVVGQNHN
ncbi:MAG: hypothetical protein V4678_04775, partial [Patescibacteria group bacterium]